MTECVGFTDRADAEFTLDGISSAQGDTALGSEFRELYDDEADDERFTLVEIDI
jgi:hypothetical protein